MPSAACTLAASILMRVAAIVTERPTSPVRVTIGKDALIITDCPPVIIPEVLAMVHESWRVSVQDGGLHVSLPLGDDSHALASSKR